jgi:Na+/H+-dicarboxylate symporter
VIQLIKAVATPLVFLAVTRAIATSNVRGGSFLRVLGIATLNVSVALAIGLGLSNLVAPGARLNLVHGGQTQAFEEQRFDWMATLKSFIPHNVVTPFADNSIFSVVILALLFGFALRVLGGESAEAGEAARAIQKAVSGLYRMTEIILSWVLHLIPFAVFAVVAKTVG